LVVNSLADKYRTPVLFLLASHPDISKNTEFVSQICFDNTFQASVAALFVRDELLLERVAVFKNPDSYHSSSLADEFIRKFRSIDGDITDVISVSLTTDYGKILSHLRESDVQLLYLPMAVGNAIELRKQLSVMGWSPKGMGADGILTRAIVEQPEEVRYLEGLFATDLYSTTVEITPYGRDVLKTFRSLYESRGSTFPAIGVEGMDILMDAINRCGEFAERECINAKLHDTVDFEGLMGNITIQSDGKASRPLVVNRIRNKQLKFVVKVY
ncbi:MAG: ABC transporter substrate-binding protein, partial [Desulfocapsa sp.]|nr:ABC transporter substrate-binding protein [Desulfocapsa sp.]